MYTAGTASGKKAENLPENRPESLFEGGTEQKPFKKNNPQRDQIPASIPEKNFKTIKKQLDGFKAFPLGHKLQRKYWIIQTVYLQQLKMFESRSHQVADRIVSIHESPVRPIVRGKSRARTEFGAKIHFMVPLEECLKKWFILPIPCCRPNDRKTDVALSCARFKFGKGSSENFGI